MQLPTAVPVEVKHILSWVVSCSCFKNKVQSSWDTDESTAINAGASLCTVLLGAKCYGTRYLCHVRDHIRRSRVAWKHELAAKESGSAFGFLHNSGQVALSPPVIPAQDHTGLSSLPFSATRDQWACQEQVRLHVQGAPPVNITSCRLLLPPQFFCFPQYF